VKRHVILAVLLGLLVTPFVALATGPEVDPAPGVNDPLGGALGRLGDALRAIFLPRQAQPTEEPMAGTVWKWQATLSANDSRLDVPTPARYTIEFGEDGRLFVRADCNTGFATYRRDGLRLEIGAIAVTRASCPPDSLDQAFLRQLAETDRAIRDGERLVLLLRDGSGSMIFVP
jgi:heat shock protein HslJ